MKVPVGKIRDLDQLITPTDYDQLVNMDSDPLCQIIFGGNFGLVDDAGPFSSFTDTVSESSVISSSPVRDQDNHVESCSNIPGDIDPPETSNNELPTVSNNDSLPPMNDDDYYQLFIRTLEENFTDTELGQLLFSCSSPIAMSDLDEVLSFLSDGTESIAPVTTSVDKVSPLSNRTEISSELKSVCQEPSSSSSYKILRSESKWPVVVHKNVQLPTLSVSLCRLSPEEIAKLKIDLKVNSINDSKGKTRQGRKRSICQENFKAVGESKKKRKTESLEDIYSSCGASGGPLVENFQRINNRTPASVIKGRGRQVSSEPRNNQCLMDQTTPAIPAKKRGRLRRVSLDLQSMTPVHLPSQKTILPRYNLRAK